MSDRRVEKSEHIVSSQSGNQGVCVFRSANRYPDTTSELRWTRVVPHHYSLGGEIIFQIFGITVDSRWKITCITHSGLGNALSEDEI